MTKQNKVKKFLRSDGCIKKYHHAWVKTIVCRLNVKKSKMTYLKKAKCNRMT